MRTATPNLPDWLYKPLRRIKGGVKAFLYHGNGRFCPVCGKSSRRFARFGAVPREDALCVHCEALERHRLLWLFLQKKTNLFDGSPRKMLHVAPEPVFESRFAKQLGADYLSADLFNPRAMVKMDITHIQYPDQSFDVIYCSHVLEHVQNDRQAMREFFRVLRNNGWAILLVPITSEETFEDPSITDPAERLKAFGQEDHVRKYGPDYADRLRDAGFTVQVTKAGDLVGSEEATRMGLTSASGDIFYCTKAING
jgi:SAM-dependent methyltransferase